MIKRLLDFFGKFKTPPQLKEEPIVDRDNIYVRLKMALDEIGTTEIRLTASPVSLGNIDSFSRNLEHFIKSLQEVNAVLKENTHIQNGLFYIKNNAAVSLDQFLFVQDGYYTTDVSVKLMKAIDQIDIYYDYMKEADQAGYGFMEHNHRQLYVYTETLIQFLNALIHHFGH